MTQLAGETTHAVRRRAPYGFFVAHPLAYTLSIAGSAGAAVFGAARARMVAGPVRRRFLYLLAVSCAVECVGIIAGTERQRYQ